MKAVELMAWSMSLGAIAAVGLARVAGCLDRPSRAQAQAAGYHAVVFLFVLVLCGLPGHLFPGLAAWQLQAAQVVAGPLCVGLSNRWIRNWLHAEGRDALMASGLTLSAWLTPLAGAACLLLPPHLRLPAAMGVSLASGGVTLWLTVRAGQMGDPLAPTMAAGCLLTLPAIGGLYAVAIDTPTTGWQVGIAACAALCNALTGLVLWRRERQARRQRDAAETPAGTDPVTRLDNGASVVPRLIKALQRRRRTGRDGAVLAIVVFDVERVAAQAGQSGVNELFVRLAHRIERQMGVVNPVGRYWDRCFITWVEALPSPAWLRTVGLRLASGLRRPMEVTAADGRRVEVRPDIGVGIVHLARRRQADVEDVLHEAQQMAEVARSMRSRAAIEDPATGAALPVEQAQLGPRPGPGGAAGRGLRRLLRT